MGILHRRIGLNNEVVQVKTKVYDVANKRLIKELPSISAAAEFTGVNEANIRAIVKRKGRSYTNKLNTIITFR